MNPGDFRYWESPQTLPALFIGPFEHVERCQNLKFAVERITDIQNTVLSSSEGTAAIHLAFTAIFLMVVSCSVLCCLHVDTYFHVLEGDHLLSHWLKVGRTLTQSNRPSIFRTKQNSANGKDGDPHRHVTGKSWRSTAELTTNVKIAVNNV